MKDDYDARTNKGDRRLLPPTHATVRVQYYMCEYDIILTLEEQIPTGKVKREWEGEDLLRRRYVISYTWNYIKICLWTEQRINMIFLEKILRNLDFRIRTSTTK